MSGYIFKDCAHRRRRACRLVSPKCFQARELGRALHCCLLKETQCVQSPRRLCVYDTQRKYPQQHIAQMTHKLIYWGCFLLGSKPHAGSLCCCPFGRRNDTLPGASNRCFAFKCHVTEISLHLVLCYDFMNSATPYSF